MPRISRKTPAVKPAVGWREWVALPAFGVDRLKAKVDTGARSSSLHAHAISAVTRDGETTIHFKIHPVQRSSRGEVAASALLLEWRNVRNSGGHVERRPVIETRLRIGDHEWPIELTLTSRDEMGFRMLLGRQAVRSRFVIDPGRSYVQSKLEPRSRK